MKTTRKYMGAELPKAKFAGVVVSLGLSVLRQILGPDYSPLLTHALGCSPGPVVTQRIWEGWHDIIQESQLPAFLSPSYRRRWLYKGKKKIGILLKKTQFAELVKSIAGEKHIEALKSMQIDRIPRLSDIERELAATAEIVAQNPKEFTPLIAVTRAIQARIKSKLLAVVGSQEEYNQTVLGTFIEICLDPSHLERGLTLRQFLDLLGLSKEELKQIEPGQLFRLIASWVTELSALSTDEAKELVAPLIGRVLIQEMLGRHPYGDILKTSLDEVEDEISDGSSWPNTVENRLDFELCMEQLPAAQRRAVEIYKEARDQGYDIKELCKKKGENYEAIRQNFRRAKLRYTK